MLVIGYNFRKTYRTNLDKTSEVLILAQKMIHFPISNIVSATRRIRDIKMLLSVDTRAEEFNISNAHGRT